MTPIALYLRYAHLYRQALTRPKSCPNKTATYRSLRFFQLAAMVPIGRHIFKCRPWFVPGAVGIRILHIRAPVARTAWPSGPSTARSKRNAPWGRTIRTEQRSLTFIFFVWRHCQFWFYAPQPGLSSRRSGDEFCHQGTFRCCPRARFRHAPAHRTDLSVSFIHWFSDHQSYKPPHGVN